MSKSFASLTPVEFRALVEVSLAKEDFNRVRRLVSLPNCPPDILAYFAQDYVAYTTDDRKSTKPYESRHIIEASLENPNLPLEVIRKYFDTVFPDDRRISEINVILRNPSIPEKMLRQLYSKAQALKLEDRFTGSIVRHDNCPMELLEEQVKSSSEYKRGAVASHTKITSNMIQRLLKDDYLYNRVRLAQNPSVPLQVFDKMIVKGCDPKSKEKIDPQILQALIKRSAPGERREELITLLLDRTKNARARLIATEFTQNPDIAAKSCYDKAVKVRKRAVKNPITPTSAIVIATLLGNSTR